MNINLATVLGALPSLVPMMGQAKAVADLVDEIIDAFNDRPADQATLKEAVEDLQAENDEGHRRYQAKLAEAARR